MGQTASLEINVAEKDVDSFIALSGDDAPLHSNVEYAHQQGFQGRLAHGLLVGAYISRLIGTRLPGPRSLMMSCDLRFIAPLLPPKSIIVKGTIVAISEATGVVEVDVSVCSKEGEKFARAKVKSLVGDAVQRAPIK